MEDIDLFSTCLDGIAKDCKAFGNVEAAPNKRDQAQGYLALSLLGLTEEAKGQLNTLSRHLSMFLVA